MNPTDAVRYLHERHAEVIDPPDETVDAERHALDMLWFQMQVCDWVDERDDRKVRRALKTMSHLWMLGDDDVRVGIARDFFFPHLLCHPDLPWVRARMDDVLLDAYRRIRGAHDEAAGRR